MLGTADSGPLSTPSHGDRLERVIRPPDFSIRRALEGLASLRRHRDLLYTLTLHRIRVRYKQSLLGIGWAVLQPLGTMAVLTVVFAHIARIPSGDLPYAVLALAGLVPWTAFSNAVTSATHSLTGQPQLVTRVYFPREILPLTYICAAAIDCAIAGGLLVVVMALYGIAPGSQVWMTIPVLIVLLGLVTGVSLIAAATQVRFRDVGVALPIALQLLMFASPVAYPLDAVPQRLQFFFLINPLAGIVENFRRVVVGGSLHGESLAISIAWAAVVLPLGYMYFKRMEATVADVI
jgi:lipopolysaccharide transport system permease protein